MNIEEKNGKYECIKEKVEFRKYLEENNYTVYTVSDIHQKNYGCNGLNLGSSLLMIDDKTTEHLKAQGFKGRIEYINFKNMSCMYGSLHCCTQVSRSFR